MTRKCSICGHGRLKEINIRLLNMGRTNETFAAIASGYEHVNTQNLRYHFYHHLDGSTATKPKDKPVPAGVPGMDGMDGIPEEVDLQARESEAWEMYRKCLASGDVATALKAEDLAMRILNTRERREEEGKDHKEARLQDAVEWITLQALLLKALERFPEALAAVLKAIKAAGL